jgi:hypothetical protein
MYPSLLVLQPYECLGPLYRLGGRNSKIGVGDFRISAAHRPPLYGKAVFIKRTNKQTALFLVPKRTIPTERLPMIGDF